MDITTFFQDLRTYLGSKATLSPTLEFSQTSIMLFMRSARIKFAEANQSQYCFNMYCISDIKNRILQYSEKKITWYSIIERYLVHRAENYVKYSRS